MAANDRPYPHVFTPIELGPMKLRNRIMVPPHGSAIGNLWGTEPEAEQHIAYWESRALDGAAWIDGIRGRVRNHVIPGFEAHGYGAESLGNYRQPNYVERVREAVSRLHEAGAVVTSQLTVIGGVPHAPGAQLSSPLANNRPHVMTRGDIAWYVDEYRFCASQAWKAGLDGLELHLNHDDMLEWFLSPHTNDRDDRYGGSLENRARFAVAALRAVRDELGADRALGVRFNMREEVPGGYDVGHGVEIAQCLDRTGLVDYLHTVIGSPWGDPSYVQPQFYEPAQWADIAGQIRDAVSIPVVYAGRVNSIDVAEDVLASGFADVVGMARAYIAERDLLTKAREGRANETRPCIGGNDCISRQYTEGLPFGCAVNPHVGTEWNGHWPTARNPRQLLVVGGGPAGVELAALAAESDHSVELWEAGNVLGGQLRTAANGPSYEQYNRYLDWQTARLERAGVTVRFGTRADAESVVEAGPNTVAVATGSTPHIPAIPGVDLPHVVEIRDVLRGAVDVGERVLIVAKDDHLAPLNLADQLSSNGSRITMVYGPGQPGQLLGRYILGGILARLFKRDVRFRHYEEVVEIRADSVTVRNIYSGHCELLTGYDAVALACGGDAESTLYEALSGRVADVHLLGDAFAPRRLVYATRQAYALARELLT